MAKQSTSFYLSDQAHANLEAIAEATGTNKTAVVELALGLLAKQLKGETKMIKNKTIDKNSAYEAARDLFMTRRGQVKFYGDPETGQLEALLAGECPAEGYEYITTDNEGYIEYGQELCESDAELEEAFDRWWGESGDEWVAELEDRWEDMP